MSELQVLQMIRGGAKWAEEASTLLLLTFGLCQNTRWWNTTWVMKTRWRGAVSADTHHHVTSWASKRACERAPVPSAVLVGGTACMRASGGSASGLCSWTVRGVTHAETCSVRLLRSREGNQTEGLANTWAALFDQLAQIITHTHTQ